MHTTFFLKTLNCFGACNIIFARTGLLNSIHAVAGSDTTVMPMVSTAGYITIKISQLKIGIKKYYGRDEF